MNERQTARHFLSYTQRDVANTAVSVSSLGALGATVGTFIVPGVGSVLGGLVGGLAGVIVERYIDRKPSAQPTVRSS
jgi:zinc transporter ZupT